jgi:hypothetical protein
MTTNPAAEAAHGSNETISSAAPPDSEPLSPAARLAAQILSSFSPSTPSSPSIIRLSDVEPEPVKQRLRCLGIALLDCGFEVHLDDDVSRRWIRHQATYHLRLRRLPKRIGRLPRRVLFLGRVLDVDTLFPCGIHAIDCPPGRLASWAFPGSSSLAAIEIRERRTIGPVSAA